MSVITPEDVVKLTKPTDGFLCPLSANTYGLEFLKFTITDYENKKIIFEVGKDIPATSDVSIDFSAIGEDMYRKIRYNFSEDVLRLPVIETSLLFQVGQKEVRDFRMIERHYFKGKLVKSFDFKFGFCIPGSTNNWDALYDLPPMADSQIAEMIACPYETKSDSFYFVDGKLVMHNKASYKYFREDVAQAKKSYEDKYGYKTQKAFEKANEKSSKMAAEAASKMEGMAISGGAEAKSGGGAPRVGEAKDPAQRARADSKAAKEIVWSKESDYQD